MYCLIINAVTFTLDEQRRDPRCICELQPAFICHADEEPVADIHIPTCIYRCTFLDVSWKFCENFERSRISADKRLLLCLQAACGSGEPLTACKRKVTTKFPHRQIFNIYRREHSISVNDFVATKQYLYLWGNMTVF